MKKKFKLFAFIALMTAYYSNAQMGINTKFPDASAALEVKSPDNTKGVLIPRSTTAQINAIPLPAEGLIVYDTTQHCFLQNAGTSATPNWVPLANAADNGLTATGGKIQLGGTLTKPTALTTTAANTLAISGLQAGTAADNVLVADSNGVLKTVLRSNFTGADNLGNHTATQDLNMNTQNITAAKDITATGTAAAANITASTKATVQTAAIAKGTDGSSPQAGYIATAANANGDIVWTAMAESAGAINGVYEFLGTNTINVAAGSTAVVPMNGNSFTLTKHSKVLITYSLLPLPSTGGAPVQGSIDLMVDNVKTISSYYSATDAPTVLGRLGNYSTAQKIVSLAAGLHTVGLNLKSWFNTTMTNVNPVTAGYGGVTASDTQSMVARITIIIFND